MSTPSAGQIVELLNLVPLPVEGGHFRQTWCSTTRDADGRPIGTAIYYFLSDDPDSFSSLHRLKGDEVYHFYLGDPVRLLLLHPDGRHEIVTLGPDLAAGQHVQFVVPGGVWQGSHLAPGGRFALLGTTMAPGFDVRDFEGGRRAPLVERHPDVAPMIVALTREA